jgi:hypothetical protein
VIHEAAIFGGQALYSALRSASIHGVARGNVLFAILMDSCQWLLALLVLAGTLSAVNVGNWFAVGCAVAGQAIGGYISLTALNKVAKKDHEYKSQII